MPGGAHVAVSRPITGPVAVPPPSRMQARTRPRSTGTGGRGSAAAAMGPDPDTPPARAQHHRSSRIGRPRGPVRPGTEAAARSAGQTTRQADLLLPPQRYRVRRHPRPPPRQRTPDRRSRSPPRIRHRRGLRRRHLRTRRFVNRRNGSPAFVCCRNGLCVGPATRIGGDTDLRLAPVPVRVLAVRPRAVVAAPADAALLDRAAAPAAEFRAVRRPRGLSSCHAADRIDDEHQDDEDAGSKVPEVRRRSAGAFAGSSPAAVAAYVIDRRSTSPR